MMRSTSPTTWVMRLVLRVDRLPAPAIHLLVAALLALVGTIDLLTGLGEHGSLLYLLPVTIAAYHTSMRFGVAVSIASALVCLWGDAVVAPHHEMGFWIWSVCNRLALFLIVTALLIALRRAYEEEKRLARADPLTGAANVRQFHEMADAELARARRYGHPVTIALLDVDDFKKVNDTKGHEAGDRVLRDVAATLRAVSREVDVVARIGGDEFALLLPETGADGAQRAAEKFRDRLAQEMRARGWPVSFSVGVVTCLDPGRRTDELLRLADRLAYEVKRSGKNSVRFQIIEKADSNTDLLEPAVRGT